MKKLKILLLTDRLSFGGAETHLISLYRSLTLLGHDVTVASEGGALSNEVKHVRLELASRSPTTLFLAFFKLLRLIKKEKFDLLHAHARLPALLASFASKILGIPLVTTAHASFKIDFFRRRLSAWGERTIAVSEDLRQYLIKSYSLSPHRVEVIENGVDFSSYRSNKIENEPLMECEQKLLFLSRLDDDCSLCAELLCELAPRLFFRYPSLKIIIGGGGERYPYIKSLAKKINDRESIERFFAVGEVRDVASFLSEGALFVGVSRSAIEAIACSLPVIIAGNEGFFGRLTPDNYSLALASNFCARGMKKSDAESLYLAVCELLDSYYKSKEDADSLKNILFSRLDTELIARRVEDFYLRVINSKKRIKERAPKNLLFGYYGYSNLGDDALLFSAIKRAEGELDGSVGAFTANPKSDALDFLIPCFSRKNPLALFSKISKCDRLIFGGGTLFQATTSKRSLLFYISVLRLAQCKKKETLIYANGIGEIKSRFLRKMLFEALKKCSKIGLRDLNSLEELKRELPDYTKASIEPDLAQSITPSTTERAKFLIFSVLGSENRDFFVVFPHFNASRVERAELEIALRAEKSKGFFPIYVACSPLDAYPARSLMRRFGGGIIQEATYADLLAILPLAKSVISMRYHPLLAARTVKCRYTVIGCDPKLNEFREKS